MKEVRLFELLKTLSKEECIMFAKFIDSPYFNSRKLNTFYKYILKFHPAFENEKLKPAIIHKSLFPGEKFTHKRIDNLNHRLLKLLEEFFIELSLKKNTQAGNTFLMNELFERKLLNHLSRTISESGSLLKKETGFGDELLLSRRILDFYKCSLSNAFHDFPEMIKSKFRMHEHLTAVFMINQLALMRDRIYAVRIYNYEPGKFMHDKLLDSIDIEGFIESLNPEKDLYYVPLKLHYLAFKAVSEPTIEKHYYDMKKIFHKHFDSLSRIEKYCRISDLISYCTTKPVDSGSVFLKEIFDNIRFALENKIYKYSNNDYFSAALFRNVILVCINLGKLKWLEEFLDKYTLELKPEYQQNMKNLALSKISYSRNKFDKSLEYLSKIKYDFFLFKLDVKDMMLFNFYELGLYEQAYSLIDAYKHFLKRTREYSSVTLKNAGSFVKNYSKLLKIKMDGNDSDIFMLEKQINSSSSEYNKEWLLKKLKELRT